jgi:hypothetical protein
VATWDDVRQIAMALPEVSEVPLHGDAAWKVRGRLFVWARPLRPSDRAALGDDAPAGPILGARTPDEGVKSALMQSDPGVYFTTPHFDGSPVVLVRLHEIDQSELEELVTEAWLVRAPKRLARSFLDQGT